MKLSGKARRLELTPETPEEKQVCQDLIDGKGLIYWGDSETSGGALIINSHMATIAVAPPAVGENPVAVTQ